MRNEYKIKWAPRVFFEWWLNPSWWHIAIALDYNMGFFVRVGRLCIRICGRRPAGSIFELEE